MKFKNHGVIDYPIYINTVSEYLGRIREMFNISVRNSNKKYDRGDLNISVDVLGIKAELIAEHFLFMHNVKYETPKLIDVKPVIGADIIVSDKIHIDVKGIRDYNNELLVSKEAHNKPKGVTHYWFIQPLKDNKQKANYWIFTNEEVDNWEIKEAAFTTAYYKDTRDLIKELNEKKNNSNL